MLLCVCISVCMCNYVMYIRYRKKTVATFSVYQVPQMYDVLYHSRHYSVMLFVISHEKAGKHNYIMSSCKGIFGYL